MNKIVLLAIVLVLLSTAVFVGFVRPVVAQGTIYVRPDGSVDPPTAPIQRVGDVYTFTENIYDSIVVQRGNMIIDGNGNVLQGAGTGRGLNLKRSYKTDNVTIRKVIITGFFVGIYLEFSTGVTITENTIRNCGYGIYVWYSDNNTINDNTLTNNTDIGIKLWFSFGNTISNNNVTDTYFGLWVEYSVNFIYHNNFINNTVQAYIPWTNINTWDDGYPSGGNYWSNYNGTDMFSGPYQNEAGSDGIGDTPYVIDENNKDRYPLIATRILRVGLLNRFGVVWKGESYYVDVIGNSTVSEFQFKQSGKLITFNVTGPPGTIGYCNVSIPMDLLKGEPLTVLVDGLPPTPEPIITSNTTHTSLYFTYSHSKKTVEIKGTDVIPEFPTWISMLLLLIVLTVAIAIYKRRLLKTLIH